ncbi:hypothetical protein GX48_03836 [Paracoccidioides brasiliensis]|nr:hypothetical protein GX48_03836 [Paracoccidioides brasiliensis]
MDGLNPPATASRISLGEDARRDCNDEWSYLFDIYIQLYRQQFGHVGALTLDSNNENWVFKHNRRPPLS